MIYITGDCHGEFERLKNARGSFTPSEIFKQEDYLIVCGDMGLLWKDEESWNYQYNCKVLNQVIPTVLFVPGNHENYDWIERLPVSQWHGGKVRKVLGEKVIMLERGEIYEIEGHTFWVFGGASSHDYEYILDPADPGFWDDKEHAQWHGHRYRILGQSWWPQELPNEEEMENGIKNLERAGWKVDYVISHCCSSKTLKYLQDEYNFGGFSNSRFKSDVLTDYFDIMEEKLRYGHWFFGHYHRNMRIDGQHTVVYEVVVPLDKCSELQVGEEILRIVY